MHKRPKTRETNPRPLGRGKGYFKVKVWFKTKTETVKQEDEYALYAIYLYILDFSS